VRSTLPYDITLQPGWNQIGNPYAFPIIWENIIKDDNIQNPVYYDGTEYQFNVTQLLPWEGYFVNNTGSTASRIRIVPDGDASTSTKTAGKPGNQQQASFTLQLHAYVPGTSLLDSQNFLGFHESSKHNVLEPPSIGEYVRLTLKEEQKEFAYHFKPLNSAGAEWPIEIVSSLPEDTQVKVNIRETGTLPEHFELFVVSGNPERRIPVLSDAFTVSLGKAYEKRKIRLLLGTPDYAQENLVAAASIPDEFRLEQNYPNPFNPETTIRYSLDQPAQVRLEIYNLLGERIATLVDEHQNSGSYVVQWQAKDDFGQKLASGVYIYRLITENHKKAKKMILLR
jgi:hypothetical protein